MHIYDVLCVYECVFWECARVKLPSVISYWTHCSSDFVPYDVLLLPPTAFAAAVCICFSRRAVTVAITDTLTLFLINSWTVAMGILIIQIIFYHQSASTLSYILVDLFSISHQLYSWYKQYSSRKCADFFLSGTSSFFLLASIGAFYNFLHPSVLLFFTSHFRVISALMLMD